MTSFADDNNEFALAMYGQLRSRPGNLFFSPFGVRTALLMSHAGARGETAEEMRKALCISSGDEEAHLAGAAMARALNAEESENYELTVANSLWCHEGAPLEPGFLELVERRYESEANIVDFCHAADAACKAINEWGSAMTKRRVRDVVPRDCLTKDTRLVLANAIYFRGLWEHPFESKNTCDEPFFLHGGERAQAPVMSQWTQARYTRRAGYQAVELAYRGRDVSMLVLLPDRNDGLPELEQRLSVEMLRDCLARTRARSLRLYLPRFEFTSRAADLRGELTSLGMRLAFSRFQADFSGINGCRPGDREPLFISAVLQKSFAGVNEEGTRAAAIAAIAATVVGSPRPEPPPPVFRADHPFLFAIRDTESGAILFLGRIADPTQPN